MHLLIGLALLKDDKNEMKSQQNSVHEKDEATEQNPMGENDAVAEQDPWKTPHAKLASQLGFVVDSVFVHRIELNSNETPHEKDCLHEAFYL